MQSFDFSLETLEDNLKYSCRFLPKIYITRTDPGRRKFAVDEAAGMTSTGTSRRSSAIPTMAVMCVSGPNTNKGISRLFPTSRITLNETVIVRIHVMVLVE